VGFRPSIKKFFGGSSPGRDSHQIGILLVTTAAASAQDAIPSLRGLWKGTGKVLLYGTTEHLSGSPQNAVVRDLQVTHTVEGQDGHLLWGTTSSGNNDS
jgi:hypothetical protein